MSLINNTPQIPKQKLQEYHILIIGEGGVGKTSFAAQFPGAYFALFEGGTSGILTTETDLVKKAREFKTNAWKLFRDFKEEFLEGDHDYQTLIIDTEDRAYEDCLDYICDVREIDHPSDEGYGSAWSALNKEFRRRHRDIKMSQYGLISVSHAEFKEIENIKGKKRDKIIPSVGGSAGKFLVDDADIVILYDQDEEGNRIMRLDSSKDYDAKQRLKFEKGVIDAGDSAKEAFGNFKIEFEKAIKNRNEESGVTKEMIEKHYAREERLPGVKENIINICKEKEITPEQNKELLEEEIGESSVREIEDLNKAEKYLEFIKDY